MSEIHHLTDKEIKALADASSLIKKMSKYIERVNIDNRCLRKNLEERIKAGDVTNAQKADLRCMETVDRMYKATLEAIRDACARERPGCKCGEEEHAGCKIYQRYLMASWLHDAARGSDFAWKTMLEYAIEGRMLWLERNDPHWRKRQWK